jgi:hypothetical protein
MSAGIKERKRYYRKDSHAADCSGGLQGSHLSRLPESGRHHRSDFSICLDIIDISGGLHIGRYMHLMIYYLRKFQGEKMAHFHPDAFIYPYKLSIHLIASTSLTFPKYLSVVDRFECRRMILETISMGTPERLA